MSRVLLALIAGLALVGAWLWFSAPARAPRAALPVEAPANEPARAATDMAPPPVVAPGLEPSAARAPATREAAAGTLEAGLASAQWVEGRVVFPPGTPLDEQAFVVADGKDFAEGGDQRARVAADGRFRVAFSAETRSGWLKLEARYLYLDEAVRWNRGASAEPVLEPKLGARIEGRLSLPPGADAQAATGRVLLRRKEDPASKETEVSRSVTADLAFTFDALVPRDMARIEYDGESFLGHSDIFALAPGKTASVEIELQAGVVLGGVVHDESGAVLAKAEVQAYVQMRSLPWSLNHSRTATTGADGRFRLGALAAGDVQLTAMLPGYRPAQQELGAQALGAQRTDLELVLARGQTIAGSVRWPDGTPAEAALTLATLRTKDRGNRGDIDLRGHSDASGHFEVAGLGDANYCVKAQAVRKAEILVKSEFTGKERKKTQRETWSAEASEVAAGTRDLVLTLSTGLTLTGRVTDEFGKPLADFRVRGERALEASPFRSPGLDGNARAFRATDGSFTLQGFAPGEYDVVAEAADHAPSEPVRVTLPRAEPLTLVVYHEAVVGGLVLDAGGAPVADAEVTLERGAQRKAVRMESSLPARTDARGAFRLERQGPGLVTLRATGPGGAPSAPLELELVAGQGRDDLVLRLAPDARVRGEVVSAGGRALSGVSVRAYSAGRYNESAETDSAGAFELVGVPAGELYVSARTPEGLHLSAQLTVVAGEDAHVRLAPPDELVHLSGLVRAGGEPLAEATLYAGRLDGEKERSASSSAETDADGRYELTLPGPGRYELHTGTRKEQQVSWSVLLDVPEVEAFHYDVSIPLGRISGRVSNASGNALADIEVRSEPEQHDGAAGAGSTRSDAEGRYELLVPAGNHAVAAGGGKRRPDVEARYAEARVRGLVLAEGAHLRGVDLVLVAGGTLEGRVRHADGSAAAHAQLSSEQDGRTRYLGNCDENGDFHLDGLTPGPLLVRATDKGAASREAVRVEIVAGETRRVELELVPAVWVHLTVRDARGTLVGSELTAVDASGRRQMIQSGPQAGDAWLGPLPPGHYAVRAQRDQQTVERELEVTGKEEKLEVALVFE
ncbi:MAG: carboxypeptidase regulatory-like domain-containing protein [Planctomycetes bacterium]|nr:carboxypeptidase regulatory-like domain-containing protein [Planctomycetota bacterium]